MKIGERYGRTIKGTIFYKGFYRSNDGIAGNESRNVRLEYGLYFMKANGDHRRKVFKISEKSYQPGIYTISKRHKFVDLTTRKHYKGTHRVSVLINGEEKEKLAFMLI